MMTRFGWLAGMAAVCVIGAPVGARAAEKIAPKVMVIATYEVGKDTGDVPGELQNWAEKEHLDQAIKVPGIAHPVLTNGKGLYAISGITSRDAVQMMALAMDERFDLRHTYFLLSGIAGGDPATTTLASAVWIRKVVDGDPVFEIDSRETPKDWPYGTVAHGVSEPGKVPANVNAAPVAGESGTNAGGIGKMVFTVNPSLVEWAYGLTKDVTIEDTERMAESRAKFKDYAAADKKPTVMMGDSLGADHFWHGAIMNQWARDWVRLYTGGTGVFSISDTEDQSILIALAELGRLGKVDPNRVLILRTVSNFTVPPTGVSPEKSLFENLSGAPGYVPSLEANYKVGSVVVRELLKNWDVYEKKVP
jgi:purine nucleoside permease